MLPFLLESGPPVPGDSPTCVLDGENGDHLFVNDGEPYRVARDSEPALVGGLGRGSDTCFPR